MKMSEQTPEERADKIMQEITEDGNLCMIREALEFYFKTVETVPDSVYAIIDTMAETVQEMQEKIRELEEAIDGLKGELP